MELRKDYILNRWVIIAQRREQRPKQFKESKSAEKSKKESNKTADKNCFFCPGNEHQTPPEIGRIGKMLHNDNNKAWLIRWFANKFSAVDLNGDYNIKTANTFFTYSDAYGYHEVIVETPDHKQQLYDLSIQQIAEILKVYSGRITELSQKQGIKYVSVFKNHGKEAGTSIIHSHSQAIAYNNIPATIKEKTEAAKKFDSCPYCKIISIEATSDRRCFENQDFAAFCPYASRFNYEIMVFPKKHVRNITYFSESEYLSLADILKQILVKIKKLDASYNLYLQYSPYEEDLHFHIEIAPRISTFAGFEYSTGVVINTVPPEDAARFYRDG